MGRMSDPVGDPIARSAHDDVARPSDGTASVRPPGGRPAVVGVVIAALILIAVGLERPAAEPGSSPSPHASGNTASSTARPSASSSKGAEASSALGSPVAVPPTYLLIDRPRLLSLPTDGPAWAGLREIALADVGRPDLADQDAKHGARILARALMAVRTADDAMITSVRRAIMATIGTERSGAHNSVLALGRQLASYVLAADLVGLPPEDDARFRIWLSAIRTAELGGHGRWTSLTFTHGDSRNNWGAFAGASRIAASAYLGDTEDIAAAALVVRGFLGDTSAWSRWQPLTDEGESWACPGDVQPPIDGPCTLKGIDVDGAIVSDVSRGGSLRQPPGPTGIGYTLESLQGLSLSVELLNRLGYSDAWSWSDAALKRAAAFVSRSAAAGGDGWNSDVVNRHVPWLLNARYDIGLPTRPAGLGRLIGYTDWLYARE